MVGESDTRTWSDVLHVVSVSFTGRGDQRTDEPLPPSLPSDSLHAKVRFITQSPGYMAGASAHAGEDTVTGLCGNDPAAAYLLNCFLMTISLLDLHTPPAAARVCKTPKATTVVYTAVAVKGLNYIMACAAIVYSILFFICYIFFRKVDYHFK